MSRALGLPLVLIALAVGAFLFVQQSRTSGPTAPAVTRMETRASNAVAGANFASAAPALQAWFAEHATYAGTTLPPGTGVVLVRADTSGYCLQTADAAQHELGPGGRPEPGAC
jgi:hypothetical protein